MTTTMGGRAGGPRAVVVVVVVQVGAQPAAEHHRHHHPAYFLFVVVVIVVVFVVLLVLPAARAYPSVIAHHPLRGRGRSRGGFFLFCEEKILCPLPFFAYHITSTNEISFFPSLSY